MGANSGANMLRVLGVLTTAVLMSTTEPDRPATVARVGAPQPAAAIDVAALSVDGDRRRIQDLPDADVTRLLDALASDDACVREMSVRLIGHQDESRVAGPLISKLSASDASLRAVAAFGLGLAEPPRAVDPLIGALRDATVEVRANAAWALGRIENGRALTPLVGMFRDNAPLVREAAVAAVGRLE